MNDPEVKRSPRIPILRAGLPLAAACILAAVGVALLLRQVERSPTPGGPQAAPTKPYSTTPIERYPLGSPTDPSPPPLERHGGEFPRWNIRDFPEGWDPSVARTIHAYFEVMSIDLSDEGAIDRLRRAREEFADYLSQLGPEAVPTLAAVLNAEGDFVHRRFILKALGNLGPESEQATFVLRDFFVARHSDPRNESEMWHVIDAMTSLRNQTSFDVIKDFIATPDQGVEKHRWHFVEALGEHPRRGEALDVFADRMSPEREPYQPTRNKAAQALGKIADPSTLNDLYRAAERETWFVAKQTMLGSIGKIGSPDSIPFLKTEYQKALAEPSGPEGCIGRRGYDIRLSAARALSRIGTPEAVQILRDLREAEPDERVRGYMESWIAEAANSLGR